MSSDKAEISSGNLKFKRNQILQGDCFEILADIPDQTFDLVITDPPFYILNKPNIKFKHRTDIVQNTKFDQFGSYQEFLTFTERWVGLVERKMKLNSSIYIFFGAQNISDLLRICEKLGMTYKGIIIWHKTNPAPKIRKNGYLSSTELILFMTKGKPDFNFLGQKAMHNFIETPICMRPERLKEKKPNKKGKFPTLHPTQKPLALIEKLIQVSSNPEQIILDPFVGTGTTNVACAKLDRYCIGIERDVKYVKYALERLESVK
ncbi:MAG: DNA-methyltransferase [Promethearchaeota archaeon]